MTQVAMAANILSCASAVNPNMPVNYATLIANLSGSRLDTYRKRMGCASDAGNGAKAVFARLKIVNTLRNRLFHHEPVWSGYHIASVEQAMNKIRGEYRNISEILGWMSPELQGLLSAWGFDGRFALACDAIRFDRKLW